MTAVQCESLLEGDGQLCPCQGDGDSTFLAVMQLWVLLQLCGALLLVPAILCSNLPIRLCQGVIVCKSVDKQLSQHTDKALISRLVIKLSCKGHLTCHMQHTECTAAVSAMH